MSGSPFPIDALPDVPLLKVLARLPLMDLIRVDGVSSRWSRLQAVALDRVRSLTMLVGQNPMSLVKSSYLSRWSEWVDQDRAEYFCVRSVNPLSTLSYTSLYKVNLDWLASSLVNVRRLQLVYSQVEQSAAVQQVAALLNLWRGSLVHLTVLFTDRWEFAMSPANATQLFGAINSLPRLKHLFIEIPYRIQVEQLDLPILARLEQFQFYSRNNPFDNKFLLESLQRYGQNNDKLKQIVFNDLEIPKSFLNEDKRLCSKVTKMCPDNAGWDLDHQPHHRLEDDGEDDDQNQDEEEEEELPDNGPQIELICDKFTSLTHLRLMWREYSAEQMARALSKLSQLFYLDLDISEARGLLVALPDTVNEPSLAKGPQLSTVQVLSFKTGAIYHHSDLGQVFNFGWIFPELRMAFVSERNLVVCEPCRIVNSTEWDEDGRWMEDGWKRVHCRPESCLHQFLAPFKGCKRLRKLSHTQKDLGSEPGVRFGMRTIHLNF